MYILPSTHPAQVNLASAMPPATSNINPILIASPPPFHAPGGIHSNTNSLLTNPDGSPIVASIGPVSTARHPLEKAMGAYTVSVPSATTIPSAAPSASATATVNSSKSILKTDEELRTQAEHFAEMAEMHRLQKEDAGRQKEQEQREQQQQKKKKEEEERKNREGNRLWRILGVSIAATVVTSVFALLWAWLHAQKKKMGKEVQGSEEREGREAGERIEMGLARRWAAEEVDARDGPTVTVTVAPPAEVGEAKAYAAWGASTEALRLYDNNEREVQPVDTLAQPQYREVEVVSRAAPLAAFLAAPGRVSAENPWESMEYRRESF